MSEFFKITIEKTKKILMENMNYFVHIIDELHYSQKNKLKLNCYIKDNIIIILNENYKITSVRICIIDNELKYQDVVDVIKKITEVISGEYNLFINLSNYENFEDLKIFLDKKYIFVNEYTGFIKIKEESNTFKENCIRNLCIADESFSTSFQQEDIKNRPPFNILFNIFIKEAEGEILGYFINNTLIGYLSYVHLFDNVYDVDFIYVLPQYRGSNVGMKLAYEYAHIIISKGGIAFWSNAQNIQSKKIARGNGFILCRKELQYHI